MTDKTRIRIAAIVTASFLAGISAVGLAARTDTPTTAAASPAAPAAAAVQQQPASAPIARTANHDDEAYEHEGREEHEVDG